LIDRLEVADIPLVFTLNQPPQAVAGLRADLVSRLLGGLLLPVSLPGQTAREKLALDWAQEARLNLSSAAWEWLLNLPQTKSYPGLMGTLRKLQVHFPGQSREYWEPADLQAVLCLPTTEANLTWPQLIIETVAQHFDLPAELLYGSSRRQTTVQARGLAMTLIRALCNCSLTELGQLFGNRDHSTVLNAVDATRKRFHTDRHFEVTANRLLEKLEQIASLQRLPFSRHSLPECLRITCQQIDSYCLQVCFQIPGQTKPSTLSLTSVRFQDTSSTCHQPVFHNSQTLCFEGCLPTTGSSYQHLRQLLTSTTEQIN
jgi:hypothetical protein